MNKVSIIGLGSIGAGIAQTLINKGGFSLTGFDVQADSIAAFGGKVTAAKSPAAAADGTDTALVAVMNDAQVRDVLTGDGGLLHAPRPPSAIVILSTITIDTVMWASAEAAEKGVALLDCGVSGGPQALAKAANTAMVGGTEEAFALVKPVLSGFSDPVVHCGELGNGMRAKLARNLIFFTDLSTAWEGARLALAAGVPLDKFVECVASSDEWVMSHLALLKQGAGLDSTLNTDPGLARTVAGYADKDLRAALALAEQLGVEMPTAKIALERFPDVAGIT